MKIFYIFIFVFSFYLDAKDFKVASYNVENLFDLILDGTEYKEYRPNTKTWNKESFQHKIKNISKVINDLDADIIALQEIESKTALEQLVKNTPQYKYSQFLKKSSSSVGVALLSKFPIKENHTVEVDKKDKYARYILKSIISIENKELIIYINHWRSKRAQESKRIIYAMALKKDIDTLHENQDYIIVGDLNSNYNEFQTFKYDKKLNDTFGITGINQILNTTEDENFIHLRDMLTTKKKVHYNLWLELSNHKFSTLFRGEENTPDNIIVSKGLFDTHGISYVQNSFTTFKKDYLIKNKKIIRWNSSKQNGYSDHLPIYATFSTDIQKYSLTKIDKSHTIKELYKRETIENYPLNNVIVIYKSKKIAIIKRDNDRAIMIFNPPNELQLGFSYNITVDRIDLYNGLKEIQKISNIQKIKDIPHYANYYLDANSVNLLEKENINNIITNLTGVYKRGYLYFTKGFKEEKIKLYFHKELKRAKDGEKLTITSGHLSIYKSKIQIVLYSKKDFITHIQDI